MSNLRFLRSTRRGGEVTLGADGRPQARPEDGPARAGLDAEDAEETAEAAGIVEEARQRADDLLRDAMEQAAAVQHDAYREGREQGYRDGVAEARAELADALALVQTAAADAKGVRDRVLFGAEREVVELVLDIARSVIGEQAKIAPPLVLDTVERALARAGAQNVVRIRVHPEQREIVAASIDERRGDASSFAIVGDGTVEVGGCLIDTEAGQVDARLDVQLDEVARLLRAAVPDEGVSRAG